MASRLLIPSRKSYVKIETKGLESAIKSAGIEEAMVPLIFNEIRALNVEYPPKSKEIPAFFLSKDKIGKEKHHDQGFHPRSKL